MVHKKFPVFWSLLATALFLAALHFFFLEPHYSFDHHLVKPADSGALMKVLSAP